MKCEYCGKPIDSNFKNAKCDRCGGQHPVCGGCQKAPLALRGTLPHVVVCVKTCPPPEAPKPSKSHKSEG